MNLSALHKAYFIRVLGTQALDVRERVAAIPGVTIPEDDPEGKGEFAGRLEALEHCDAVVADLRTPLGDDAAWELGYAVARGKAVLAIGISEKGLSPMILETAYILTSLDDLCHAVETIRDAGRPEAV